MPLDSDLKHCRTINILAWTARGVNKSFQDNYFIAAINAFSRRRIGKQGVRKHPKIVVDAARGVT